MRVHPRLQTGAGSGGVLDRRMPVWDNAQCFETLKEIVKCGRIQQGLKMLYALERAGLPLRGYLHFLKKWYHTGKVDQSRSTDNGEVK
jgi:hypothetical protein